VLRPLGIAGVRLETAVRPAVASRSAQDDARRRAASRRAAGSVWKSVGYGLGIVVGEVNAGFGATGHNGGGPGSCIAVYRRGGRTAAGFGCDEELMTVEQNCVSMLM
jgi:hypothetical protein